jgi:flagellar motor switch protein FliG
MSTDLELTGRQKAAIFLVSLGTERASSVLQSLRRTEVTSLMTEIAGLGPVSDEQSKSVIEEFKGLRLNNPLPHGDLELARELLEASLGPRAARDVLRRVDETVPEAPFTFLDGVEPDVLGGHLRGEHPQIGALVISHLPTDLAAAVLGMLDEPLKQQIGVRIGTLGAVNPDALRRLEESILAVLGPRLERSMVATSGGVDALVELLNRVDKSSELSIFEALEAFDEGLAREVRAQLFVFDDLVLLSDKDIQAVLRGVDSNILPMALKGVRVEVRSKVTDNLSSRAKENLLEEIELLGPARLSDVEEAQTAILAVVASLEESGELVINRGGDEFVD